MNELKHHGVLGMRWGVRRSNPSGSGTGGIGKFLRNTRHNDVSSMIGQTNNINNGLKNAVKGRGLKKGLKTAETMTDDELKAAVNRMNLENQFSQLSSERVSAGQISVSSALDTVGNVLMIAGSAAALYGTVKGIASR